MKKIPKFPNYSMNKGGQIWSHISNRWLKPIKNRGYTQINLGRRNLRKIHHLVLETYIGPRPKGMECRHLNGDRADNRLDNLKWGTRSENMQDAVKHGTCNLLYLNTYGENHSQSQLSNKNRKLILHQYRSGLFTQKELSKLYGVSERIIWSLVNGETWPFAIAKQKSM